MANDTTPPLDPVGDTEPLTAASPTGIDELLPEQAAETEPAASSHTRAMNRRRSRRRTAIILACVSVIACCASFLAGWLLAPPTRDALREAGSPIPVTARAEVRSVNASPVFAGSMVEGNVVKVHAPAQEGAQSLVTRQLVNPGQRITPGMAIGEANGALLFAMPAPLPLYRDLEVGMSGSDVDALQTALTSLGYGAGSSGVIDTSTLNAADALFAAADAKLPTHEVAPPEPTASPSPGATAPPAPSPSAPTLRRYIPAKQFIALPLEQASIISVAPVGTQLTPETPLAQIQTAPNFAQYRVDIVTADSLKPGAEVRIQSGATTVTGRIEHVGAFQAATKQGEISGCDIKATSSDPAFSQLKPGSNLVIVAGETPPPQLALPATAVRRDAEGSYVERVTSADDEKPERVAVTVVKTGGGWAAIRDGGIVEGDLVRLT